MPIDPRDLLSNSELVNAGNVGDLEALQEELARLLFEVDPEGGLRESVELAVGMLHRYGIGIVHVDTGRYKNSMFWHVGRPSNRGIRGWFASNVSYGIYEEARGGSHATFARTERDEGPAVERLFNVRITGG